MSTVMALGRHRFAIEPVAFETLSRTSNFRHASQNLLGTAPENQFLGPGEQTWSISGKLFPRALGGLAQFRAIEADGDRGASLMLVSAGGLVFGNVVITSVTERHSHIGPGGVPGVVDFDISLKRDPGFAGSGGLAGMVIGGLSGGLSVGGIVSSLQSSAQNAAVSAVRSTVTSTVSRIGGGLF